MKRFLVAIIIPVLLTYSLHITVLLYFPLVILTYLIIGGLPWLRILSHTLPRDLFIAYVYVKLNIEGELIAKKNVQIHHLWLETVTKNRNKIAITYGDKKVTFGEMNNSINRMANYFVSCGVTPGGTVALYSENRIEYICLWLAMSKIGIVTALINNNLRGKSLVHSIQVASCKVVVFSPNCVAGVAEIYEELGNDVSYYSIGSLDEGKIVQGPFKRYVTLPRGKGVTKCDIPSLLY